MSNDILFVSILIVVILIVVGVFYFWNLASTKPIQYPNNKNLQGIYVSSQINERCSVGPPSTSSQSLLPGYNTPPPCREGYSCIKVREEDAYGYCKADIGTKCFTVYDCAPVYGMVQVQVGPSGFTGLTGTVDVFCNNVCSTQEFGGLLETCGGQTGPFSCDSDKNLICNQLSTPPNGSCFNKLYNPCTDDSQCAGGVCGTTTLGNSVSQITGRVCLCPGTNNPINTPVCMYADGGLCRYNQECYGGTCVIEEGKSSGICRTAYFPGEICRRDISGIEKCLDGYGCSFLHSPEKGSGICQPKVGQSGTNTNPVAAVNGGIGSLCTSYNVLVGPTGSYIPTREGFPYLSCTGDNIECNYNLSTRVPVGFPSYTYLQGYGVCAPALAKIGQPCNTTFGCSPPGICLDDDLGQGYCSPPQYLEDEGLTVYINNDIALNSLQNTYNHSLVSYIHSLYPSINIFDYNTMSIQLVGGGGGGGGGNIAPHTTIAGATGYYGGGGGGSGYIKGFLYAESTELIGGSGPSGTFNYAEANDSNIYPTPVSIDLTSFFWDDIQLRIGVGGTGGSSVSFTSGAVGGETKLQFYKGLIGLTGPNHNFIAGGGKGGNVGSSSTNGAGGDGYNGGGAGIGGISSTAEAAGGSGDLLNGGENGYTAIIGGQFESGDGGGTGGGLGGAKFLQLLGTSEGGGGGGGSGVILQDVNQNVLLTGGNGTSSVKNKATIPAIPGFPYTGGGGGGGSIPTNIDGSFSNTIANGKKGGSGYAIVRFSKVKKDINYSGTQNPTIRVPASGSSGVCADGYISNGLGQFGQTGAGWCIPQKYYTCNTNSYCMNTNNTAVISNGCNIAKIGVYIPTPPSLVSSGVNTDYLGQWHFLNFPYASYSSNARISSYQSITNGFYPTTKLVYYDGLQVFGQYCNTTTFWYATFNTEDISPNNPQNVLSKTIVWKEITIDNGNSTFKPLLLDIKFTSAGNIAIFVREKYAIKFPFVPGNISGTPQQKEYNRIYTYTLDSAGETSMLSTGKLNYTQVTIGPMFCIANPTVTNVTNDQSSIDLVPSPPNSQSFDEMYFNGYSYSSGGNYYQYPNIIWDVDDLINKSIAVCFKDRDHSTTNSADIFSASIPAGGIDTITTLDKAIRVDYDYRPTAIQFYTGSTTNFPIGPQKILYPYYNTTKEQNAIVIFTPPSSGPVSASDYQTVLLEGTDKINTFGFNFNRIIDIGLFDFYTASSAGQFKYNTINTKYQNEVLHFSKAEQQIDGYAPDFVLNGITNFLSVGNLDRSMYAIVGTCE